MALPPPAPPRRHGGTRATQETEAEWARERQQAESTKESRPGSVVNAVRKGQDAVEDARERRGEARQAHNPANGDQTTQGDVPGTGEEGVEGRGATRREPAAPATV